MLQNPLEAVIERLAVAGARLEEVAGAFAEAEVDPAARYTGGDPARAVEVEISGNGSPLAVRVSPDWSAAVGHAGLGAAVLVARTEAVGACLRARREAAREADERRAARAEEDRLAGRVSLRAPAGAAGSRLTTADLAHLLPAAQAELGAYQATLHTERAKTVEVSSPDGHVTVAVRGSQPTSVVVDPEWLRLASTQAIGQSVRAALVAASQRPAAIGEQMKADFPGIAALRAAQGI